LKKILVYLRNAVFIALGVYIFYVVFKDIDFSKLWYDARHANYLWIILALLIVFSGHVFRALRWKLLIVPLGYNVKSIKALIAVMINYAANVAIPRAGELSRPLVINRTDKIPFTKLVGTIIVERALDLIMLILLTVIAFAMEFNKIKDTLYQAMNLENSSLGKYLTLTNLIITFFLFAAGITALILIKKSSRAFKKHPVYLKIREVVSGMWQGVKTLWKMKTKWQFVFYTLLIWLSYFLLTYLIFFSIEATSHLGLKEALFILTIGSIGFIIPVTAGTGYYAAAVFGLSIYAIPEYDAKLYAFLGHTSQTMLIIVGGIVSYIAFLIIQNKNKDEQIPENTAENTNS